MQTDPLLAPLGERTGARLGWCVASAGDFNGDGWVDFLAGAPNYGLFYALRGRAYVFLGGPDADETPDLILGGRAPGDRFGQAVAGVGDVNGDGYADIAVGAPYDDAGGAANDDRGRVSVYFGGDPAGTAPPDTVPDLVLAGEAAGDRFGWSVAAAGDVNGDGLADLLVGAPLSDASGVTGADRGRAYLFLGGAAPDAVPDLVLAGESDGDEFGWSVAGAGDVDGDDVPDLLVGALLRSRAYVFRGGDPAGPQPPSTLPFLVLDSEANADRFGYSVAGAGDLDGDGLDDVLVGALLNDAGGVNAGRAYVFRGRAVGGLVSAAAADRIYTGDGADDWFGRSVAAAGDVDGDGRADILVGAPYMDGGGGGPGRAYLFLGAGPEGPVAAADADLILSGATDSDKFGHTVGAARDPAAAGYSYLLAGAPLDGPGGSETGRFIVLRVANRAPSAQEDRYDAVAGDSLTVTGPGVLGNDSDPDGDPLQARLVSGPQHGVLTLQANGGFGYRHDGGVAAADTFAYAAVDGRGGADTASVALTIADLTPPGPVTALQACSGHRRIAVVWNDPVAVDLAGIEVWRARWNDGAGGTAWPLFDDAPGSAPPTRPVDRAGAAADAAWSLLTTVAPGTGGFVDESDTLAVPGVYAFELFARDTAGNWSARAANGVRGRSYRLGDVAQPADGLVDTTDVQVLATTFGTAAGDATWVAACDVGPTDDGSVRGVPQTDGEIDFEDLMIVAIDHEPVGAPALGGAQPLVELSWIQTGERSWSLMLPTAHPGLQGLRLSAALRAGLWVDVTAGALLSGQTGPLFLRNIDARGFDACFALLGRGSVLVGAGELMRVVLSEPAAIVGLTVQARGVDNVPLVVSLQGVTGVTPPAAAPPAKLFPNPFNPVTRLQFTLLGAERVRVTVYGADGRRVARLADRDLEAGPHELTWRGLDDAGCPVASGIYFCRLEGEAWRQTLKMALLR